MTVQDALRRTQGKDAGPINRSAVRFAETRLSPEEKVLAAVIANIAAPKEHFPGIVVLTDRRIFAACALPGIQRFLAIPADELVRCEETPSFLNYKVTLWAENTCFSLTVNPEVGEQLSVHIARLNGDERVDEDTEKPVQNSLFNPILIRSWYRRRHQRVRSRREAEQALTNASLPADLPAFAETDVQEMAQRLERQLEQARSEGAVSDTDPKAVAARLAAKLAEEERNSSASERKN